MSVPMQDRSESEREPARNVLGQPMVACSLRPLTGFFGMDAARQAPATRHATWSARSSRRRFLPSASRAETTSRRPGPSTVSVAFSRANAGASACCAGRKRSTRGGPGGHSRSHARGRVAVREHRRSASPCGGARRGVTVHARSSRTSRRLSDCNSTPSELAAMHAPAMVGVITRPMPSKTPAATGSAMTL